MLMLPRNLFLALALVVLSGSENPQMAHPLLVVANQGDRNVSLIGPAGGQTRPRQLAALPVSAVTGHEVAVDPETQRLFVPIYGDSGVGLPGSDGRAIDVFDLHTRKRIASVDLGHGARPHSAVYSPADRMIYVTTELDQSVTIINPRDLRIVGAIPTGQPESHMLVLSHDGKRGYTANVGPGTVSVLNIAERSTIKVIRVSTRIQRISISRDDRTVFTADQSMPRLGLIDTATNRMRGWIALPAIAYGTAATIDGHWLLLTLLSLNEVGVLDLRTQKIVRQLPVGAGPTEILLEPDNTRAYISCGGAGTISVIEISGAPERWKVLASLEAGRGADGLAWAP